jgi:membrane protease YdiL (CAAX protease family)
MQSFFIKLKHSITRQRIPAGAISFKSIDKEISFLLFYAVFYIIAGYIIGLIIQHYPLPLLGATKFTQDAWYTFIFKIVLLLFVPGLVFFGGWKYGLKDLQLGIKATPKIVLGTFFFAGAGFFLNAGHIAALTKNIPLFADAPLRMMIGIMMPLFMAAIPEEFYFRGYLQTRLEKKWNRLTAILVTNILFAAWHLPSRYLLSEGVEGQAGDWGQVFLHTGLPVFIVGVIFSIHWSRYRNMVLLVLTHWAIDILPSLSAYFKIRY